MAHNSNVVSSDGQIACEPLVSVFQLLSPVDERNLGLQPPARHRFLVGVDDDDEFPSGGVRHCARGDVLATEPELEQKTSVRVDTTKDKNETTGFKTQG